MRAALVRSYGPPEAIEITDLPDPEPQRGELRIDVRAAAVNYPDVLIASNRYQVSAPLPLIPGSEVAGVVSALGEGVSGFALGDAVTHVALTGAFAERVVATASRVTPMPPDLSFEQAAAFGVVYRTAYTALRRVANARAGEWIAVLGAAGGVGSAGLAIAKHLGCRVLAIASSEAKRAACRAWGADAAIEAEPASLRDAIREATGGGADVVLDPVGGAISEPALRALRWGGRFVTLGFASGEIPRIPLNLVLLKGIQLLGLDVRALGERAPEALAQDAEAMRALVSAGLRPRVGARFTLDETAAALRCVADRRAIGKVVICVGG
ncbi:MAG TPA: NADPH:quinone oxidoreductase family protein [Myxococcota bacterium]|nr:NADPH:quinone oxidoreductase family protein [Myxococcota bacterium]